MTTTDLEYLEAADTGYTPEMNRFLRQGMSQIVAAVEASTDIDGRLAAACDDGQSPQPKASLIIREAG